jgi:environmental stress-induced protein Ves
MPRIIRAADCRRMPWKNGGGETTEIAVSPAGAGLDDFDWRVSMARVETSGPFSSFAGIDRTLAILEGQGMVLEIDGWEPSTLTAGTAPLSFPADVPTFAELTSGPITDLNVMTRRGRLTHSVSRLEVAGPMALAATTGTVLLLCLSGNVRVKAGTLEEILAPFDTFLTERSDLLIEIEAVPPAGVVKVEIAG